VSVLPAVNSEAVSSEFVASGAGELNAFHFGLHLSSGRPGVLHGHLVDDVIGDAVDALALEVAPRYVSQPAGKPTRLVRPSILVYGKPAHDID